MNRKLKLAAVSTVMAATVLAAYSSPKRICTDAERISGPCDRSGLRLDRPNRVGARQQWRGTKLPSISTVLACSTTTVDHPP